METVRSDIVQNGAQTIKVYIMAGDSRRNMNMFAKMCVLYFHSIVMHQLDKYSVDRLYEAVKGFI